MIGKTDRTTHADTSPAKIGKSVHVVLFGSAAGNVRELIKGRRDQQVHAVEECFSFGPLFNISEETGEHARRSYLRNIFKTIHQESVFEEVEAHTGTLDIDRIPDDAARLVVWCGANADEQILLRAVCATSLDIPIEVVDVRTVDSGYEKRSAIGACSIEELGNAELCATPLSEKQRGALSAEWRRLVSGHHLLHIFLDGNITGVDETFFDRMLRELCPPEFCAAARLVGSVMGRSEILIGDTFLDYRLRKLIAGGVIEARDADKQLRFMRVRRRALDR